MCVEFLYTKNPNDKVPIIVIDKHIGNDKDSGQGIMGGQFLNEVFELEKKGAKHADVWINSPGGSMMEGYNIVGSMDRLECDTLNYGVAASSGGWVYLKGKKARMTSNAIFMCHNPSGGDEDSNSSEQRAFTNSAAVMISEGSGRRGVKKITVAEAEKMMNEVTFLTAEDCWKMGLCDEIIPYDKYESEYKNLTQPNEFFLFGNKILNSLLQNNNSNNMANENNLLLIQNELELGEDASTREISKSIKALKAKANRVEVLETSIAEKDKAIADLMKVKNEMEDKVEEKENALTAKADEYSAMSDKYNALVAETNTLKEKMDAFEVSRKEKEAEAEVEKTKRNETDCMNMVNKYTNRIGTDADTVAEWIEDAKTRGIEKVENLLKKLPVNSKAPTIKEIVKKVDTSNIYVDESGMTPAQKLMNKKKNELAEKRNHRNLTSIN